MKKGNLSFPAKKTPAAQQEQRDVLFEALLDAIPEFIIYYDDDLKIIWANRAAAEDSGTCKENMIGRNFFEAACGVKQPCPGCPVVTGLTSEHTETIESNVYEGKLFYTRSYPILCQNKRIPGRLFLAQDVSRLRNRYSVTEVLNLISEVFHSSKSLAEMCRDIINVIAQRFDYPIGYIMLYDERREEIVRLAEIDSLGKLSPCRPIIPPPGISSGTPWSTERCST